MHNLDTKAQYLGRQSDFNLNYVCGNNGEVSKI